MLLKGAWDYFAPFAGLQQTGGRWFPTGFIKTRDQGWYQTEFIPMVDFLRFLEPVLNEGERYDKLPRAVPYVILPVSAALPLFRLIKATIAIYRGERESLIVSHEAEDAIKDVRHLNTGEGR